MQCRNRLRSSNQNSKRTWARVSSSRLAGSYCLSSHCLSVCPYRSRPTQLRLALKWERADVLHWLLRKNSAKMLRYEFAAIIDRFLHVAIETHNEQAVVKLLEYGARVAAYRFTAEAADLAPASSSSQGADQAGRDDMGAREMSLRMQRKLAAEAQLQTAAQLWESLMRVRAPCSWR